MDIQRLRNLTTCRLHTKMDHIYEDIETITTEAGVMTHMLGRACTAMEPYLRQVVPDERFWNGLWDQEHVGQVEVPPMNEEQKADFFHRMFA